MNSIENKETKNYIDQLRKQIGEGFTDKPERKAQKQMGKEDFIKLLSAQLEHQDPTNPVKNEQMAAQLAQFSSLEQMVNMNTNLEKLVNHSKPQNTMATHMIGKTVVTDAARFEMLKGEPADMEFKLPKGIISGKVEVYDSKGERVREIELGVRDEGLQKVRWDGKSEKGQELDSGLYRFVIAAKDKDDKTVEVDTRSTGLVEGVSFESGNAVLLVGGKKIPMNAVSKVTTQELAAKETAAKNAGAAAEKAPAAAAEAGKAAAAALKAATPLPGKNVDKNVEKTGAGDNNAEVSQTTDKAAERARNGWRKRGADAPAPATNAKAAANAAKNVADAGDKNGLAGKTIDKKI